MALLFVDLVALRADDPWMLDTAHRWARRTTSRGMKFQVIYVYDANRPEPDWTKLPGGTKQKVEISIAGERYMAKALQWALDEVCRFRRAIRAVPPFQVRFEAVDGVECQALTVEPAADGKGLGQIEGAPFGVVPIYPPERLVSLTDGKPSWRADRIELGEVARERDRVFHERHQEPQSESPSQASDLCGTCGGYPCACQI